MDIVFDPGQISTLAVKSVEAERASPGYLKTGIGPLDEDFVMMRPRRVIGVQGDTSHGKTSILNVLAKNSVPQLKPDEISVYITWEDSVEDLGLSAIANTSRIPVASLFHGELDPEQWKAMMKAALERATTPLWAVGHSEQSGSRRPRLTMTDVFDAMRYIEDVQKKKVRLVCLDYLQRISRADVKADSTRGGFVEIMDRVKDLALSFNTCVVIGSQIGRDVRERKWKMPQVHDAQETSNFEQTSDGILSLWMPCKTERIGESLIPKTGASPEVHVTDRLMLIQISKQKKGKAPVLKALDFYAETNEIRPYGSYL